jgi:tRNA (guanosine-2'-O-)-methyltransferase
VDTPTDAEVLNALRPFVGEARAARIDAVAAARLSGLVVVLENLHDAHNGGAALRSCEAVGVLEVWFAGENYATGKPRFSERVTQGCEKWLDLRTTGDIGACAAELHARGFRLYAAVPGASTPLDEIDPITPAAFLIGNEHAGLSAAARAACDGEFAIPLHGFSQSVNLSVATALTVFTHASRRRRALGPGKLGDLDETQLASLRARWYKSDVRGAEHVVARARGESL